MDKTDRLRDYGLAFLLYEQGLGLCGYELIRELFIFVKLILNSYLVIYYIRYVTKLGKNIDITSLNKQEMGITSFPDFEFLNHLLVIQYFMIQAMI